MTRRFYKLSVLILLAIIVSGCGNINKPIDPNHMSFLIRYLVYPLSETLNWLAGHLWGNYGLAILVLTIGIRGIILPLTVKQYRSSKAMQAIQPEIKKMKEKYKDDPKKQQEETMKLFQANGVNPLAGCLPLLIQMPILFGLYRAIYQIHFLKDPTFLIFHLGEKDHTFILPAIAALTTFLQQKVMATQMTSQMKALMYVFPILIFFMAQSFFSALPLYWIFSNTFTIIQSYFIYGKANKNKGGLAK